MEHAIQICDFRRIDEIYQKYSQGRKDLVIPIEPPLDQFIDSWRLQYPADQNTFPERGQFLTDREELVRSKSEKIIADRLNHLGIPYQIETRCTLWNHHICYPDFMVLNIRTRKTWIWEHLGRIQEEDYASRNLRKLYDYEKSGWLLGKNLILTTETQEQPLDLRLVDEKIHSYLK